MYPIICEHCGRFHSQQNRKLRWKATNKRGKYCNRHRKQLEYYGKFLDDIQVFGGNKFCNSGGNPYVIEGDYVKFALLDIKYNVKGYGYINIEDIDLIKSYRWHLSGNGYIMSNELGYLHKAICQGDIVDHIDGDILNNRRSNLRGCTQSDNIIKKGMMSTNTSGIIGVCYYKGLWRARMRKDDIRYEKKFINLDDAIYQRLLWEKELLGDLAPQKHLFEKYNIK